MSNVSASPRISGRSRVVAFDTRLQARALIKDIYTMKSGLYNRKNKSFPLDAIKVRVKDSTTSESVITLKEKLSAAGQYGQQVAAGNEEQPVTRDLKVYQANYRKVIGKPGYGLRKLEADKYRLYEEHENDLVDWQQEEEGYCIRRCILERYSPNLLVGDTAADCTPWWNPNIFIPTLAFSQQPAFSQNRQTHTNNICNALVNAGGFGQFAARICTATFWEDLSNWCLSRRMLRLKIAELPTGEGFATTVSELQAAMLSNPTYATNNLGSQWVSYARNTGGYMEMVQKWPGIIGSYNDHLIICDPRIPTVLPSGSAAPFSMQAGYMLWNSRDARFRNSANVKDCVYVHGRGTYVEVEGEKVHGIADDRDYKLHGGVGIAGVRGQNLPIFIDRDTNNVIQQTSAVALVDLPNQGVLS